MIYYFCFIIYNWSRTSVRLVYDWCGAGIYTSLYALIPFDGFLRISIQKGGFCLLVHVAGVIFILIGIFQIDVAFEEVYLTAMHEDFLGFLNVGNCNPCFKCHTPIRAFI